MCCNRELDVLVTLTTQQLAGTAPALVSPSAPSIHTGRSLSTLNAPLTLSAECIVRFTSVRCSGRTTNNYHQHAIVSHGLYLIIAFVTVNATNDKINIIENPRLLNVSNIACQQYLYSVIVGFSRQ